MFIFFNITTVHCNIAQNYLHCKEEEEDCRDLFQEKKCHEVSHAPLHSRAATRNEDDGV